MMVYCCGFLISEGVDVALVTKAKPEWQCGRLNGVGGKVEFGESALQAMRREFQEETGASVWDWEHRVTLRKAEWVVHFFVAHVNARVELRYPKGEGGEPVRWYAISRLPANAIYNLRWLIPMCLDGSVEPVEVKHR